MNDTPPIEPNLRADFYCVVRATSACCHCGRGTVVTALALAPGHEIFEADPESVVPSAEDHWQAADAGALLYHVEQLPCHVQRSLQEISPHYRRAGPCWVNHCEHCAAPQSDEDLHCEPGGAFMPASAAEAAAIDLITCRESFEALAGGYAHEPDYFEFMRRL